MDDTNKNNLIELAKKESLGINKSFNKDIETGVITAKVILEMWIKTFDKDLKINNEKNKVELLEIFTKELFSSIDDRYKLQAKLVLSSPELTANELFKIFPNNTILMKSLVGKEFSNPPIWTKLFNKNILDK